MVRIIIAAFASLAILAAASCSSQRAGQQMRITRTPSGAIVPVELDDYVIRMPATVPAGDLVLQVKNMGKHVHNIQVTGHGHSAALPRDLRPGESTELRMNLAPGEYRVICPVGPHAALGMRMTLTVTP